MIQLFMIISVVNRGFAGVAAAVTFLLSSLPRFTTRIKVFITSPSDLWAWWTPRALFLESPPTSSTNCHLAALTWKILQPSAGKSFAI